MIRLGLHCFCGLAYGFRSSAHAASEIAGAEGGRAEAVTLEEVIILEKRRAETAKASKASKTTETASFAVLFASEEEAVFVVVEAISRKELGEDVIGLVEVIMAESRSLGSIEAVRIINLPLFWVREVLIGFRDFSKLLNSLLLVIRILIRVPPDG